MVEYAGSSEVVALQARGYRSRQNSWCASTISAASRGTECDQHVVPDSQCCAYLLLVSVSGRLAQDAVRNRHFSMS